MTVFQRKQTLKRSPKMLNYWYTLIFNVNYSLSGIKKFKTEKMKSEISLLKLFSLFVNCILKNLLNSFARSPWRGPTRQRRAVVRSGWVAWPIKPYLSGIVPEPHFPKLIRLIEH